MKPCCVLFLHVFLAINIHITSQCPYSNQDAKAAYKSGEIHDQSPPITLATIKRKLKETMIFDYEDPTLNDREKKELSKLFDAVEIMTTSRARQPFNVQNMFSSLRLVERAVKKQLKEGQISESLASKFKWDKLLYKSSEERQANVLSGQTDEHENL
ncbi:PREDICTED: uncharacterized protein LOC106118615 isoform X2 [Papilio xuthus]|uniref:Uncharacterized protein LOC106118615 isoform X2 n=1 Tax=Papilio xuthus TaxID=66420 RepID=A0AAJ6ZAW7_PAPXU|nr:PREDICTED: uncharacterized protein LOC106118615 isoform X2 [Papilio xuthus]